MKILITGANGFIGKNLLFALKNHQTILFDKEYDRDYLRHVLDTVDFVFHFAAGIKEGFEENIELTQFIADNLRCPILFTSSIQAETEYGKNKRKQEEIIAKCNRKYIYRLSNVFGRWCRPNYNNVVATFIYSVQTGQELMINDPNREVSLVYIDDVVSEFKSVLNGEFRSQTKFLEVTPIYGITVGKLAEVIKSFNINQELLQKLIQTYNA